MASGMIPWDANAARDRPAPPLHRHLVLKILDGDDDHSLLDIVFKNHLIDVRIIRGR
jgi:hypothetical protein